MDDEYCPEILVLGPGGMKGFLELGALHYLESKGHLKKVKKIVGCSIGSIIGLLLTIGYKIQEIMVEASKVNLFSEVDRFSISKTKDYVGFISNDIPRDFLDKAVRMKCGGVVPSLSGLFALFNKELITTSVNLSQMKTVYFSRELAPELSCVDAVLLSINIPLLFYKLLYKGEIYVDGAFRDPYPIDIVDDKKTNILGIYIRSDYSPSPPDAADYCYRIVQLPIDAIYEIKRKESSPKCNHILLRTKHLDVTGITYTTQNIIDLIVEGYETAKDFVMTSKEVKSHL